MSKSLTALNILWALFDTMICGLALCIFGWGAYYFNKWWVLLFMLIPLALFNSHTLVIDDDLKTQGEQNDASR